MTENKDIVHKRIVELTHMSETELIMEVFNIEKENQSLKRNETPIKQG